MGRAPGKKKKLSSQEDERAKGEAHSNGKLKKFTWLDFYTRGGKYPLELSDPTMYSPTAEDFALYHKLFQQAKFVDWRAHYEREERRRLGLNQNETVSVVPRIEHIHMDRYVVQPHYEVRLPAELYRGPHPGHLYVCAFCLKMVSTPFTYQRHMEKCSSTVVPGIEIYRKDNLSVFEIDGAIQPTFCKRLCLLAKMFLEHKAVYQEVDRFAFYLLLEWRPIDHQKECAFELLPPGYSLMTFSIVGYFSKEKASPHGYNLSCIVVFPQHQRHGYGNFLIHFSYLLSKLEGLQGSPEKPLSDQGRASYLRYWSLIILDALHDLICGNIGDVTVAGLAKVTAMTTHDVKDTLEHLQILQRDPDSGKANINLSWSLLTSHKENQQRRFRGHWPDSSYIIASWTPPRTIIPGKDTAKGKGEGGPKTKDNKTLFTF